MGLFIYYVRQLGGGGSGFITFYYFNKLGLSRATLELGWGLVGFGWGWVVVWLWLGWGWVGVGLVWGNNLGPDKR